MSEDMNAPDGPLCGCGQPSTLECGLCDTCAEWPVWRRLCEMSPELARMTPEEHREISERHRREHDPFLDAEAVHAWLQRRGAAARAMLAVPAIANAIRVAASNKLLRPGLEWAPDAETVQALADALETVRRETCDTDDPRGREEDLDQEHVGLDPCPACGEVWADAFCGEEVLVVRHEEDDEWRCLPRNGIDAGKLVSRSFPGNGGWRRSTKVVSRP